MFLGREPQARRASSTARPWSRETRALLDQLGIDGVDPDAPVRTLTVAEQQIVEIVKALSVDARVIQMDEPTAALADHEVELLYAIVRRLQARGVAILYVSHRLKEIFDLCDTITVLKDGALVSSGPASELDTDELVRRMVGRPISAYFPEAEEGTELGEPRLELRGAGNGYVDGIDLELRAGEIVGVAGLQGSGRTELVEALFGIAPFTRGELLLDGRPVHMTGARQAVKAGIALITEDRKAQGLALNQSVADNALLVIRSVFARRTGEVRRELPGVLSSLEVASQGVDQEVQYLSGGNQQKVVLAKWLATKPRVVLLDEPTRGIDVGAKVAVYQLMRRLAKEGVAILMISSELPEVIGMSDRIIVMHDGRASAELPATSDEATILSAATGMLRVGEAGHEASGSIAAVGEAVTEAVESRAAATTATTEPRSRPTPRRSRPRERCATRTRRRRDEHRHGHPSPPRPPPAPRRQPHRGHRARRASSSSARSSWRSVGRNFFSAGNIRDILTGMSVLGFVAIGQTLVILCASLDLSVPYVISLSSLIAADLMAGNPANIPIAVLAVLVVAAADRPRERAHRHEAQGERLHRDPRHGPDHQGLPRHQLPGHERRGAARVPVHRRHRRRTGADLDAHHARWSRVARRLLPRSHAHRQPHVRRRRQRAGRPPLRHPHRAPADRRARALLDHRRARRAPARQPARRRQPDRRHPGRLRPALDRGGRARRHAAHGRPRLDLGHHRRRRDLRGRRQRDERHAGEPVPEGRRARRRHRRRRRRVHEPLARPAPAALHVRRGPGSDDAGCRRAANRRCRHERRDIRPPEPRPSPRRRRRARS